MNQRSKHSILGTIGFGIILFLSSIADAPGATAPSLVFDESRAVGPVLRQPGHGIELITVLINDSLDIGNPTAPPRDTIPAAATITFRWRDEPTEPGTFAVHYLYKLDEPDFVTVDPPVNSVSYNTHVGGDVVNPGIKLFTLRVVDNLGNVREITRRFQMNYTPDTWFAGPDLALLDARFGWSGADRHLDITDWNALPDLSSTLMGCDSLTQLPAERPARKTFFEIYGDRLYVRSENDTVHLNSWVIVPGGGRDIDSRYGVRVTPNDPGLADTAGCVTAGPAAVVHPDTLNGSPIGLNSQMGIVLYPGANFAAQASSGLYPLFDPLSFARNPKINAHVAATLSGKAYFVLRAEDGDGGRDRAFPTIGIARSVADVVDAGLGTPAEIIARRKILTFYVNRAPFLRQSEPAFVPHPGEVFSGRSLHFNLLADDSDPLDPSNPPGDVGGPSSTTVLRWDLVLQGRNSHGDEVSYRPLAYPVFDPAIDVVVPDSLVGPGITAVIELCDCSDCEVLPGSGRCETTSIPIQVPISETRVLASLISADASPRSVHLRWDLGAIPSVWVERRTAETSWRRMVELAADGSGRVEFEDRSVVSGTRYAYRLALTIAGEEQHAGEVWIDVPVGAELALLGVQPNPVVGRRFSLQLSLATAEPARIELFDTTGRRWMTRELSVRAPGRNSVTVDLDTSMPPGVYQMRLVQGRGIRTARVALIR